MGLTKPRMGVGEAPPPFTISKTYRGNNAVRVSEYVRMLNISKAVLVDLAVREFLKRRGIELEKDY